METKHSCHEICQKSFLLVHKGKLLKGPVDLAVSPDFDLLGFVVGEGDMVAREDVLSYEGDVIVLKEGAEVGPAHGQSLMDKIVMTRQGKYFGRIEDFTLDSAGKVDRIYLADLRPELADLIGTLPVAVFDGLGEEVLFVTEKASDAFQQKRRPQTDAGMGDRFSRKFSSSVSELSHRFNERMKQVDRDAIYQDLSKITEQVNREFSKLLDGVLDQVTAKRVVFEEDDLSAILMDLHQHTVSKPILDKRGEVILMPGQRITEDKVRRVVEAEKVAELYRLALRMEDL